MSKRTKYIIGALILVVLIIIIKSVFFKKEDLINVSIDKVTKENITETVSANGKVQPEIEVKISSDVSGEVTELLVKEGQTVQKGDVLARINPDIYESSVERLKAGASTARAELGNSKSRLAQAQSQFTKEEASYNRNKKLFEEGTISASEFETIKSVYEVAKASLDGAKQGVLASEFSVKSSEASLKEATDQLQKTTIMSPVSGIVSKLSIEKGERVVGTSQMAGTEMMRIANVAEMEVRADVNENDIVRVSVGDTAVIEVDAYLERKFKGVVTEVANSANVSTTSATDQVTNFLVKIRMLSSSYQDLVTKNAGNTPFRPGMSASVDIQTHSEKNVLSVPIQAVTTRDKIDTLETSAESTEPEECVFVYSGGTVHLQRIKTGIQNHSFIHIKEGLKEGEEIVSAPYSAISNQLKDKSKVKVVPKDQLYKEEKK